MSRSRSLEKKNISGTPPSQSKLGAMGILQEALKGLQTSFQEMLLPLTTTLSLLTEQIK